MAASCKAADETETVGDTLSPALPTYKRSFHL